MKRHFTNSQIASRIEGVERQEVFWRFFISRDILYLKQRTLGPKHSVLWGTWPDRGLGVLLAYPSFPFRVFY